MNDAMTMKSIEIHAIDTRFEPFRLKDQASERRLLSSISEYGIRDAVQGVWEYQDENQAHFILLDGFKRLRCAKKLHLQILPFYCLGEDEATGIFGLLRQSNHRSLHILEQARLVDQLQSQYGLSSREIAEKLEKSPAWVSVRTGMIQQMSETVREAVFSGKLAARAYMYTLRQFTRVNTPSDRRMDNFVGAVAGRGLSCRQIDQLARGYFQGSQMLKDQIEKGQLSQSLEQLKNISSGADESPFSSPSSLSQFEQQVLKELQVCQKYMNRLIRSHDDSRLSSSAFFAEACVLIAGVREQLISFQNCCERFYDRCQNARTCLGSSS